MRERARASSIPVVFLALLTQCTPGEQPSQQAQDVASYAVSTYADSMEAMLAQLMRGPSRSAGGHTRAWYRAESTSGPPCRASRTPATASTST
jgi:hypothetical protein